jgi:TolB protein
MMRLSVRRSCALALVAALAVLLRGTSASAQDSSLTVRIGLTYAPGTKPGVLVLPVNGANGDSIRAMIQRDLDYSDRANVIAGESLVMDTISDAGRGKFNYPLYARLGAAALVQATMTATGLHVAVHDVRTQKVERVKDFPLSAVGLSPEWRQQVHAIADAIEFWVTGVRGIAATRILYQSGGRIWQVDSDGANPTALTAAGGLAQLYPAWHPKATSFAYVVMTEDGTRVRISEMNGSGAASPRTLPARNGSVNTSPIFSPDGQTILYAHGMENGTDLYAAPVSGTEAPRRVTVSRSMDAVSPSYSPDGRRIVFVTNRPGGLGLYIADADGTNAEALTPFNFGDKSQRTDPSWSPDGRLVAFQAEMGGAAQIYSVSPRDRGSPKQYTSEGRNEDPSWSPDSRHLVFTSNRSGSWQLWVLDTETGRVRQLTRAASGAKAGAWSPRLMIH